MKLLGLLRHAKSSWKDPDLPDFDRPLKGRGRDAALLVGAELRRRGLRFDVTLASPARRVRETLGYVEKGAGAPLNAHFQPNLYEAPADQLLEAVKQSLDEALSLLLVGHNPGLQALGTALVASDDPHYPLVAAHFPTAALLLVELPLARWKDVEPGTGRVAALVRPADLRG